jgi:hypothetical protein
LQAKASRWGRDEPVRIVAAFIDSGALGASRDCDI